MIQIKKASTKAIQYACKFYHYAHHAPAGNVLGYSVFNDDTFCGVVTFGSGANNNIGTAYGLKQGEVCELTRVALNGKQPCTSQVVAACLKRLKHDAPLVRLVVSYSDVDQKHYGTIYQATNWIYVGCNLADTKDGSYIIHGKRVHGRRISNYVKAHGGLHGLTRLQFVQKYYDPKAEAFTTKGKRKYLMPLDKHLRKKLLPLAKPYDKDPSKLTYKESHPEQYEQRKSHKKQVCKEQTENRVNEHGKV